MVFRFLPKEIDFFNKLRNLVQKFVVVPKSISTARPGDFVTFQYADGDNRIVLVTRPVVKRPGTGNLLLTGFKVGNANYEIEPQDLIQLYNDGDLDEGDYRTYNLRLVKGQIIRMRIL